MKNIRPKFRAIAFSILGTSALLAGGHASAALVTQWSYITDAVFVPAGVSFVSGSEGTTTTSDFELSWGASAGNFLTPVADFTQNRSALTIGTGDSGDDRFGGGDVSGVVLTDQDGGLPENLGELALGTSLSHWNNPIWDAFPTLQSGRVLSSLTLTPMLPVAGPSQAAPQVTFDFRFQETPNDNVVCAGGTANPCADLYGIVGFGNFNQTFDYLGIEYFLSTFVLGPQGQASPVGTLLDAECSALGLGVGCQGFRTAENGVTTAQFGFSIGAQPFTEVPEPGSMALLGLGLLGLGAMGRKFKR